MVRKVSQEVIKSRDGKKWKNNGNRCAYDFNSEVVQVQVDLGRALEEEFKKSGAEVVPDSILQLLEKGMSKLNERNKDLLRADDAGWPAVQLFHRDPICATADEEKRWKWAKSEAKDQEKKNSVSRGSGRGGAKPARGRGGFGSFGYGGYGGYGGGYNARGGGFASRGREWNDSWRRSRSRTESSTLNKSCSVAGLSFTPSTESVTSAANSDTRPTDATSTLRRTRGSRSPSTSPNSPPCSLSQFYESMVPVSASTTCSTITGKAQNKDLEAAEKLEYYEKSSVRVPEGDEVVMFDEEVGIELKVRDTLRSHLAFWESTGASSFALSVIKHGYKPRFCTPPKDYEEANNSSYKRNREWANVAVQKLYSAGLVKKVKREEIVCCNPLTVASNAAGKLRLCIDLSRHLNEVTDAPKFRIESTREALQTVKRNDWAFSFDLKSAYHQINLHEDCVKFFGFKIEGEDGLVEYFCYVVMPFGLNDASRVLTKVLKSPLGRWRDMGIRCFIHIDDGFGICPSKRQCLVASEKVRSDLISYGLLISENKCSWGARQSILWTGFVWDFKSFKLWVGDDKLVRAEKQIKLLLENRDCAVPAKQVASLTGLLGSFALAMGAIVRFRTRSLLTLVAVETDKKGWKTNIFLEDREIRELLFWDENLRKLNGFRMRQEDRVLVVSSRDMFSDASAFQMAGAEFVGASRKLGTEYQAVFSERDQSASSTYRELSAIEEGIKVRGEELRGSFVRWGCDNWAAVAIVKVGSMKPDCHQVALNIADLCKQYEIELDTFWLSREELQIRDVDSLSKEVDTGDYKLSTADFKFLEELYGPFSVDMFASTFSYQFRPFVARIACSQAAAVDAFTLDWGTAGFLFLHPPVGVVTRVLRYAEMCGAVGLLVVPFWPGAIFMTELRDLEKKRKVGLLKKFRPELVSPEWIKSKVFHGRARFDFYVYHVNFAK